MYSASRLSKLTRFFVLLFGLFLATSPSHATQVAKFGGTNEFPGPVLTAPSSHDIDPPSGQQKIISLTEEQELEYLETVNSPDIKEVRRYIDSCLAGELLEPEDQYPCYLENVVKGMTITEHPVEHVSGSFAVIHTQEMNYGGLVFTILFTNPPHLAVNVWVYREGGVTPDVRSFQVAKLTENYRARLVLFLDKYLTDERFTR